MLTDREATGMHPNVKERCRADPQLPQIKADLLRGLWELIEETPKSDSREIRMEKRYAELLLAIITKKKSGTARKRSQLSELKLLARGMPAQNAAEAKVHSSRVYGTRCILTDQF
jgi:hypothetical protein